MLNLHRFKIVILSLATTFVMASCGASDELDDNNNNDWNTSDDFDEIEQSVFDSWIETNWPSLIGNRQKDGYYIEVLSEDKDLSYPLTNTTSCWVDYNITSKDLQGNICHTRSESVAIQQGTFTRYTRYAPTKKYITLLDEDIYEDFYDEETDEYQDSALMLAMRASEMNIDGVSTPFSMTVGSKIRLWMPSRLIDNGGNGSGGYAGQFKLPTGRPLISEIEITNVVINAEEDEKEVVDWFIDTQENPSDWKFVEDLYADYIYINYNYTPNTTLNYINPYNYTQLEEASNFDEMEQLVNKTIADVFGNGIKYTGDEDNMIDDNTCYFWYITRTIDGFIIDSNIEEVKKIIYGTSKGSSEDHGVHSSFDKDVSFESYIKSMYYTIPKLEFGQWATMVTTSLEAYDIDGMTGSATAAEILPYTPLIFQIFIEPENYDF